MQIFTRNSPTSDTSLDSIIAELLMRKAVTDLSVASRREIAAVNARKLGPKLQDGLTYRVKGSERKLVMVSSPSLPLGISLTLTRLLGGSALGRLDYYWDDYDDEIESFWNAPVPKSNLIH